MNTSEVATTLNITPRLLRQFLRSTYSTFVPVGSGARYEFTDRDLPTISKRFAEWKGDGKPRPDANRKVTTAAVSRSRRDDQQARDARVWSEEGQVVIEDIRDPRVRRRVRADAMAAEDRLMQRLLASGLHITQLGDRRSA